MHLKFFKYQGTGNDFIMLDNRPGDIRLKEPEIVKLCDRKFGIGSDGLILIEQDAQVDFKMNFYNPDGSQSFCGNGSRCAVRFAQFLGCTGKSGSFVAIDGLHSFTSDDDIVNIRMQDVKEVMMDGDAYVLQTGSPHFVMYVGDLDAVDILPEGRAVRYNERYGQKGINVNFVQEAEEGISMRTYERGVEDETLSCGTGVTAAALSFALRHPGRQKVKVVARGGKLEVKYVQQADDTFTDIWLCGPAKLVFSGEIEL